MERVLLSKNESRSIRIFLVDYSDTWWCFKTRLLVTLHVSNWKGWERDANSSNNLKNPFSASNTISIHNFPTDSIHHELLPTFHHSHQFDHVVLHRHHHSGCIQCSKGTCVSILWRFDSCETGMTTSKGTTPICLERIVKLVPMLVHTINAHCTDIIHNSFYFLFLHPPNSRILPAWDVVMWWNPSPRMPPLICWPEVWSWPHPWARMTPHRR